MWDKSTQTTWQCNDCNYTSDYPMEKCINCDSLSVSQHTADYGGDDEDSEKNNTED